VWPSFHVKNTRVDCMETAEKKVFRDRVEGKLRKLKTISLYISKYFRIFQEILDW
jgi:hypothetical protein